MRADVPAAPARACQASTCWRVAVRVHVDLEHCRHWITPPERGADGRYYADSVTWYELESYARRWFAREAEVTAAEVWLLDPSGDVVGYHAPE